MAAAQVLNEAFWNSQLKGIELVFLCFSQSRIFLIDFRIPKNYPTIFLTLVETSDIVEFHQKALQESLDHRDSCFPLLTDCRFAEF